MRRYCPGTGYGAWDEPPPTFGPLRAEWTDFGERLEEVECDEPDTTHCEFDGVARHQWVDLDPGDPETGPRPQVFCVKCGVRL